MIKRTTHEHIERARKRNKETKIMMNPIPHERVSAIQCYRIEYVANQENK